MKALLNIAEYSIEIYKKLFFRLTVLSIFLHLPIFLLDYFKDTLLILSNQQEGMVGMAISTLILLIPLLNLMVILLFTGYIIMKSFVTFTEMIAKGVYKLNITLSNLIVKLRGLVFYGLFFFLLLFLVRQFGVSVLFMLGYFLLGRNRLLTIFPWVDIPIGFGFWEGILGLFISLGLFVWVFYLFVRWMFGYQGMFIDDQKNVVDSIRRSFFVTKGFVGLIILYSMVTFLFQGWLLGSATVVFRGITSIFDFAIYPLKLNMNHILLLVSFLFYPLQVIFSTVVYIFLKFKKDALALEFKMLKMMGKDELKDLLAYDPFESERRVEKNELGGVIRRFLASFIDFILAALVVVITDLNLSFLGGKKILWNLQGANWIQEPYHILLQYAYFLFLVLIANFILTLIWELILKGGTPGKLSMGLRILTKNEESPKAWQIIVRNLMRLIDFLPFFYLGGFILMTTNRNQARLGDFLSGTKVVKHCDDSHHNETSKNKLGSNLPPRLNEYPITPLEFEVLVEFLDQTKLSKQRRAFFSHHLNIYFHLKFNPGEKYNDPYEFFKDIVSMNMHLQRESF
jgi:uncharacterized RDD family membrane protein YckC